MTAVGIQNKFKRIGSSRRSLRSLASLQQRKSTGPRISLDSIESPDDLKRLSIAELDFLAEEVRVGIIRTLSQTGGHLASNLGVVELTLALHYVFDSPKDKLIWDVGHQAYTHKIVTGRWNKFPTLRQHRGLSGFPKCAESFHDQFDVGHSSTSISAALGMAIARDLSGEDHEIIAIIGDGALTGGMALEALNHLGHLQTNLIIVLNDNEMSINENVGGLSRYTKRIKDTHFYRNISSQIHTLEEKLGELSAEGPTAASNKGTDCHNAALERLESIKNEAKDKLLSPGIVFEKLGINYSGPHDGHDIEALVAAFEDVKNQEGPRLIHAITEKGRGYRPAEENPAKFHGVEASALSSVNPDNSGDEARVEVKERQEKSSTFSRIFADTITRLAENDDKIVVITPATAEGTKVTKFAEKFPERCFDVGICEQHAVTLAAGMAKRGLKPVVSVYSSFLQRAYDQVLHDVCIQNLPVIFAIDRGGLVDDGETHHGIFDIPFLRHIPNIALMSPKDGQELRNMVFTAAHYGAGPIAIRFPRATVTDSSDFAEMPGLENVPIGRSEVVRNGTDVAIFAFGPIVESVLEAADALADIGIEPHVVNLRFAKPLDADAICAAARSFPVLVTVEESALAGGLGSAILEVLEENHASPQRLKRIGIDDTFVEHGSRDILLDQCGLTGRRIAASISSLCREALEAPKPSRDSQDTHFLRLAEANVA